MARDIEKAVAYYEKLTDYGKKHGSFKFNEGYQILEMATVDGNIDTFTAVTLALEAGYAVGYRTAKRHDRQKRGAR